MRPDIVIRSAQCASALRPIASKYFRQLAIAIGDKVEVAKSHLFPILCFGGSGWHPMGPSERKLLRSKVMGIWRSTTASHFSERIGNGLQPLSDQALPDEHGLFAPQAIVSLVRINLLVRVITRGSKGLRRVLFAARESTKSWLAAVESDLTWVRAFSDDFTGIVTMTGWIKAIRANPTKWRNLDKKSQR